MRQVGILCVLLANLLNSACGQDKRINVPAAIDRIVDKMGVKEDTPGVAIAVIFPRGRKLTRVYGLADMDGKTKIDNETVFELASLGKSFTAIGIMQLQEARKLTIADDITKHIPEFPNFSPDRPVKIIDLLRHESGLPDYMQMGEIPTKNPDFATNEDYVAAFKAQRESLELSFKPGLKHEYNNTNYMLLATIIARASGKSYGEYMRDHVFLPANMRRTFVYDKHEKPLVDSRPKAAVGYVKEDWKWAAAWGIPPKRRERLLTAGDGAIWSCIDDMSEWGMALRDGKLVSPETFKAMLATSKTSGGLTNNYGFGFELYPNGNGLNGFGHGDSGVAFARRIITIS